jgi:hypothetical protein
MKGENYSGGMKGTIKCGEKHAAKFPDSSTGLKGKSVDAGATRKGVAPTPKTLGPRKNGV